MGGGTLNPLAVCLPLIREFIVAVTKLIAGREWPVVSGHPARQSITERRRPARHDKVPSIDCVAADTSYRPNY
ncbi:hypothetical protein EVAR_75404_1 [Eumeta japonica]|uniref:Uncharacterized protein n=1 Tax=Eumeta variegata TaxID=151549 RepID=A0A4C1TJW6_EUMVA|nr:hypothetical protein EVAR_75404_1 [Eumeta japonica]